MHACTNEEHNLMFGFKRAKDVDDLEDFYSDLKQARAIMLVLVESNLNE
jgi:hypothetical protein